MRHWMLLGMILGIFVLAAPRVAMADDGVTGPQAMQAMQDAMERYFRGERLGGVGFASVGAGSLLAGGLMLASSSDFQRGMGYPMLALGGAQLIVGTAVMITAGPRIRRFTRMIPEQAEIFADQEGRRMRGVHTTFRLLVIAEIALAVSGTATAIIAHEEGHDTLAGVGAGIAVQSVFLFVQDTLASRRATRYLQAIRGFQAQLGNTTTGRSHVLSWSTGF